MLDRSKFGALKMRPALSQGQVSEVIEMALCDDTPFEGIQAAYGLNESAVMRLMQENLKPGSYRAWRKRVRAFRDRRAVYKETL